MILHVGYEYEGSERGDCEVHQDALALKVWITFVPLTNHNVGSDSVTVFLMPNHTRSSVESDPTLGYIFFGTKTASPHPLSNWIVDYSAIQVGI